VWILWLIIIKIIENKCILYSYSWRPNYNITLLLRTPQVKSATTKLLSELQHSTARCTFRCFIPTQYKCKIPHCKRRETGRGAWWSEFATHHVTRHNTHIHNILSIAPQLSISQKTLGTLPEDFNVLPKHKAMNNWSICCFLKHIFTWTLIFKGLTARRLYKSFGVKELKRVGFIPSYTFRLLHRVIFRLVPHTMNIEYNCIM
jgi:hypothetical protein